MSKRKQIISALLVIVILIASFLALFFQEKQQEKKQISKEVISSVVETLVDEAIENIDPVEIAQIEFEVKLAELDCTCATSREEWFKHYKALVDEYADILGRPETIYDRYSSEDLDLMFKVVQAEIGNGYSFEQKANVCSVILNRVQDGRFGNSLREVLNGNQFSTISNGAIYRVKVEEKTILACEYAFSQGDTTGGALYFHSGAARNSFSGRNYMWSDGAHHFY